MLVDMKSFVVSRTTELYEVKFVKLSRIIFLLNFVVFALASRDEARSPTTLHAVDRIYVQCGSRATHTSIKRTRISRPNKGQFRPD
jgi:hypothetical protein